MSTIEWTEQTWNPIAGCSVTSPGCKNCYAMRTAHRLARNPNPAIAAKYAGTTQVVNDKPVWTGTIGTGSEAEWTAPLRRRKPTTYFVNSMGDLFHPNVTDDQIDRVFAIMALAPQHRFQILTKYPERMRAWFAEKWQGTPARSVEVVGRTIDIPAGPATGRVDRIHELLCELLNLTQGGLWRSYADPEKSDHWTPNGECKAMQFAWPLPNVWLGVSVEDQTRADARIPLLLDTPAAVRFVSCEPLLGPVDLNMMLVEGRFINPLHGWDYRPAVDSVNLREPINRIDWVIVGGESGTGARAMHPDWARSLRDQCAAADVPFFFKQWGQCIPWSEIDYPDIKDRGLADYMRGQKSMDPKALDGVIHHAMPEA